MTIKKKIKGGHEVWIIAAVIPLSILLWVHGLLTSEILDPEIQAQKRQAAVRLRDAATVSTNELEAARAYWLRYEDIRLHPLFGEHGPLGIAGAREHYRQHGRHEGRIYAPIAEVEDPEQERVLAEAYWRRYAEVAESQVWGRKSALGIRGPRDHYRYVGRRQNKIWENSKTEVNPETETISRQPN